jgi:hypothetical protein
MPRATKRRTLRDLCVCGHGRNDHLERFGPCALCRSESQRPKDGRFVCAVGLCDRFTWDPDREDK